MQEKGRSITKSYSKPELEQLFYDVMAVGTTLCMPDRMPKLGSMAGVAVAGMAALLGAQLEIMDSEDALYVDIHDIPSIYGGEDE